MTYKINPTKRILIGSPDLAPIPPDVRDRYTLCFESESGEFIDVRISGTQFLQLYESMKSLLRSDKDDYTFD